KHRKAVLSFPFQIDPWTHHAALCDEAQRIRTSVFLILSTHVKERWMLSSFGSRLKDYVFENQGVETEDMIQREIIASLHTWEPRITDIEVDFQREDAVLLITISYLCTEHSKRDALQYPLALESG
ncbi:MAG: GPW/gp25 family protein, partial [Lachnospiraceae bacterium]|nr:GPW/gp25 family protein [Lachnospiraceae bacterium]